MSNYNDSGWEPVTRLGRKVQEGEIEDMETALNSGLPLKEPEIIDQLLPDWKTKYWTSTWSSG